MNTGKPRKSHYMDEFYKVRTKLSKKYANMSLDDMRAEMKKSVDECMVRIEQIRDKKSVSSRK